MIHDLNSLNWGISNALMKLSADAWCNHIVHGAITVLASWSKMIEDRRRQLRTYRTCVALRAAG